MTLKDLAAGDGFTVIGVEDSNIRPQALRLGIYEGAELLCCKVMKNGPLVVSDGYGEIAIGRKLAGKIEVIPNEKKDRKAVQ